MVLLDTGITTIALPEAFLSFPQSRMCCIALTNNVFTAGSQGGKIKNSFFQIFFDHVLTF
jgi:hypothetical protein